jgi:hypothetical protein
VIALLILIGLMAGYLLAGAVTGKIKRHNAANAVRVDVGLPQRTLLRRLKK